ATCRLSSRGHPCRASHPHRVEGYLARRRPSALWSIVLFCHRRSSSCRSSTFSGTFTFTFTGRTLIGLQRLHDFVRTSDGLEQPTCIKCMSGGNPEIAGSLLGDSAEQHRCRDADVEAL